MHEIALAIGLKYVGSAAVPGSAEVCERLMCLAGDDGRIGKIFRDAGLEPYWGSHEADTMDSHRLAWYAAEVYTPTTHSFTSLSRLPEC